MQGVCRYPWREVALGFQPQRDTRESRTTLGCDSLECLEHSLQGLKVCPVPHTGAHAVRLVNEALLQADPERTLAALLLLAPALPDIALPTAPRYHSVLAGARRHKVQVGWGSSALEYLWGSGCRALVTRL